MPGSTHWAELFASCPRQAEFWVEFYGQILRSVEPKQLEQTLDATGTDNGTGMNSQILLKPFDLKTLAQRVSQLLPASAPSQAGPE